MRNLAKGLVALAIVLVAAAPLMAQTTGRIEGRIVDASGGVLPGVTVVVTSPNLAGTRTAVTDAAGRFRLPGLPAGTYRVKAELAGFTTVEHPDIRVGLDSTAGVDVTLKPASVSETLTVTGEAPVIDVTSTTTGASFTADLFTTIPVARTFQGMAFAAPGVVQGGLGTNPSVGGASAAENRYILDGLDTTDGRFGTIGTALPFEFIQEVEVKTGGYQAEYGGAMGGVLNVLTKSGSNDFHGDAFTYYTDKNLGADSPSTATVGQDKGISKQYDFGLGLGGPLVKDKLWYYAAVNPTYTDRDFTTRQNLPITREARSILYSAKLTAQLNPNHRLVASAFGDPKGELNNAPATRDTAGILVQNSETKTYNYQLMYDGILSPNVFLELAAGRAQIDDTEQPGANVAWYEDRTTARRFASAQNCGDNSLIIGATPPRFAPGCVGGTFVQENGNTARNELRGAISFFAKTGALSHSFKIGTSYRQVKYTDWGHYPAPQGGAFRDSTGAVVDPDGIAGQRYTLRNGSYTLIEYDQNSKGETDELAFYVQDQVKIGDRVTFNLGVRFDSTESTGERSAEFPDRKLDFGFGDQIAPRLGVIIDVVGNGKSKLFAHYGKFYESVPLDINVRAFGKEQFNFYYFYYPAGGSLPTLQNPGTHYYTYALGAGTAVDPGIKAPYSEEWVAGFDYEIARNWSAGIKYVNRSLGNVVEDISVDDGHTYFITNPGGTYAANPVTGEVLDDPVDFPLAERNYRALEFQISKAFSNNWSMTASYVNSKNEGNYGGLFRQDNGQLDPNITSLFDLPGLLEGAYGLLNNDQEHQFKLYGSYQWPFKLITGINARYLSGTPISKLGAHNLYGRRERFITPRGSEGRTDDLTGIDLHLSFPITVGQRSKLMLIADVFNVTNSESPLTVDQEWTTRGAASTTDPNECGGTDPGCPQANVNYGKALTYQDPFQVRFGVKFSW
jgi:outer membrane receptor protein involved in Fe transport